MQAFRSIRVRLTLWYIVLLALILAAFSAGIYLTLRHSLYANLDDALETRSQELLPAVQFTNGQPSLGEAVPPNQLDDDQFVRLYDASGAVIFDTSDASPPPADNDTLQTVLDGGSIRHQVDAPGRSFRAWLVPIQRGGEVAGVLEVARSEDDVTDILNNLLLILSISYPATLALASFGGAFLASRALSPIDKLTRVARRLSAENLSERLDLALADDEVGRLARTFNEMLARLDASFRQQRQFTADASHELRTPLTAIKGQVEVALSRERAPDGYREVLQAVNEQVDRLIRLVGSLLTLARADAGQIPLAVEPADLTSLLEGAVEQLRPLAAQHAVELSVESGPAVSLLVDEDLLLQLVLNLLDNAIKYTPAGGQITVGWNTRNGRADICVRDTGAGIASDDLSRIFDRFYRVDKARGRAEGGAGLGLSISRWIAEAHGGTLSAASVAGQGATFTLSLPIGGG